MTFTNFYICKFQTVLTNLNLIGITKNTCTMNTGKEMEFGSVFANELF